MSLSSRKTRALGVSLMEVVFACALLMIVILTIIGYTATIHKAVQESKHQVVASIKARSLLERMKDHPPLLDQAASPEGHQESVTEYLLAGNDGEAGRKAPVEFHLDGRARHISGQIYGLTVRVSWDEGQRDREVVLESSTTRQFR